MEMMEIKNTLAETRKEKGYTQEKMAKMLEIAVSTYNQYETGARNVPAKIAEKICDILQIQVPIIFLPEKFTISKC